MTFFHPLTIDSVFFENSTNLPQKPSNFEFGRLFVHKIRKIRLYISALVLCHSQNREYYHAFKASLMNEYET
jgi:hypothetical protein